MLSFFPKEGDLNVGATVAQQQGGKATLGPATCTGILQCEGKRVVQGTGLVACLVHPMARGMHKTSLCLTNMCLLG